VTTSPILSTGALSTALPNRNDPEKVKVAAQQFEALMISQLLKTSREAGGSGGWMGTGDDEAGQVGMDMAEQEFARMMAASGGLGMAKMIAKGLKDTKV
jgi:flagellar protein FlgJ